MSIGYTTPQAAEDAYYDAIEEQDIAALMAVWEESDEISCLLPMMPLRQGRQAIREAWSKLLLPDAPLEIEVIHLGWIEAADIAVHLVEERVKAPQQPVAQAIYACNIYRKGAGGWSLLLHQNSPTPPPPELHMPG